MIIDTQSPQKTCFLETCILSLLSKQSILKVSFTWKQPQRGRSYRAADCPWEFGCTILEVRVRCEKSLANCFSYEMSPTLEIAMCSKHNGTTGLFMCLKRCARKWPNLAWFKDSFESGRLANNYDVKTQSVPIEQELLEISSFTNCNSTAPRHQNMLCRPYQQD